MEYDAVVVGSGPNGLSAAIVLQQNGLSVLVLEAKDTVGGGLRSAELTLPGFVHDICSAIHPLAAGSPFFSKLPLNQHGLEYVYPEISAAHPFDDGKVAVLKGSIEETASLLGEDQLAYMSLLYPLVKSWRERPLGNFAFVLVDAIVVKIREEGRVRQCALLIACGIDYSGPVCQDTNSLRQCDNYPNKQ